MRRLMHNFKIFRIFAKKFQTMEHEEITDQLSEEVDSTSQTVDFNLQDAIIYSTILERKYK